MTTSNPRIHVQICSGSLCSSVISINMEAPISCRSSTCSMVSEHGEDSPCDVMFLMGSTQPTIASYIKGTHLESLNVCIIEISTWERCPMQFRVLIFHSKHFFGIWHSSGISETRLKTERIDNSTFIVIYESYNQKMICFTWLKIAQGPSYPRYMPSSIACCTNGHSKYRPSGCSDDLPLVCLSEI